MFKHVLIPTDGSPLSDEAVAKGVAFAKALGAAVTLVIVIEPFHVLTVNPDQLESTRAEYEAHAARHAAEILEAAAAKARAAGVAVKTLDGARRSSVRGDHPDGEEQGCDVIAMASHGRRGMAALMLGSQTMKVLTQSKLPVLVFR